jgi:ketosteroid isomerase-like protein
MMKSPTLLETGAPCVRIERKWSYDGVRWHRYSFARRPAILLLLLCASLAQAEPEFRAALDAQRKALTDGVARRDAGAVARIFTTDAKLMAPGFETVTGRESIQRFWQAGLGSGIVKGIGLTPVDLTGEGEGLWAETGTLTAFDADGKEKDHSRYIIVWKREESEWRIHRDIVNSELAPAPKVDRVGFPKDYRTTFKVLGVPARTNSSPDVVMTAYGNDLAASAMNAGQFPLPNGAIILMEFAEALKDSEGKPMRNANGQWQKGEVEHVDVMRRGDGFGEAYGANRSGQWEFAGYQLDGTYSTAPPKSASCAQCHQKAGASKDFVFPLKPLQASPHP